MKRPFRTDDDDYDPEEPKHLGEMAMGSISQLVEYPRARKAPKGLRVRMGFHPPELAYEVAD